MSGLIATAKPYRIKAAHRRRRKVAAGPSVQRYYDPTIGRFLSVDPVSADPNTGAMFNRYVYALNNPYRFTDPDGRKAKSDDPKPQNCDPNPCPTRRERGEERERERINNEGWSVSSFRLPGTAAGADAAQAWADKQVQTGNSAYAVPGALASLWTEETATDTALTLGGGAIGRPVGAAASWAGDAMLASKLLGPSGRIFGRQMLGGSSVLGINSNSALRVGWGWSGSARNGTNVFRVSGDWVKAMGVKSGHIDLWTQSRVLP